ncbi:Hypothetical predicted protein [Lecanosticta acicola]|uniref:Uncharacterized protein n=1 Tax=Lecanosticta acicola TaxID=111012 RepID=A0AAI8Z5P0_9PEZI|nr:Hypothetical predicted protein [Lecanosticta acicola]
MARKPVIGDVALIPVDDEGTTLELQQHVRAMVTYLHTQVVHLLDAINTSEDAIVSFLRGLTAKIRISHAFHVWFVDDFPGHDTLDDLSNEGKQQKLGDDCRASEIEKKKWMECARCGEEVDGVRSTRRGSMAGICQITDRKAGHQTLCKT